MARIFISYSRADRQFIDQFIPLIRRVYGNDSVWFDDDIHGGVDWWQMILNEIEKCDIFVYLISNEALESSYCQAEFREALRLKKQIIPVIVRRLDPVYPGNIDEDLAAVLRRTQYVDMSGGFRDPNTISALYAALTRSLNVVPQQPLNPVTLTPTPQPPVPDKKKPDNHIRTAYIGGGFVLVAAIIAGIFGLWQGYFANSPSANTEPTTAVAQNITEIPTDAFTPTLSGFQVLQTTEAELTQSAGTQAAFDLTATEQFVSDSNATATAAQFAATETSAYATLLALSVTPTLRPTDTPDPLQAAFTPVARNADWTPIERDFDGVMMVLVPAGCFMMGSTNSEDEEPLHEQCFDEPFWIDKYEVTQAQFERLGGTQAEEPRFTGSNRPVERITWFEARDFCKQRDSELPTEAEWEYAARGPDGLVYPWGNTWNANNAVTYRSSSQGTANVGGLLAGVSWVGALDMSGNVWEWTHSLSESYPYDAEDGREADTGTRTDVRRVLRGGSWDNDNTDHLRAAYRNWYNPDNWFDDFGFRCARA